MKQKHNSSARKSLLLQLSVCRFFLFCCFAVFACSVFGQKVKQEAILYKETNMLLVGNLSEGKFVEGSRIKIYNISNASSYRVKKSGDEIYLKRKREKWPLSKFSVFADCVYYGEGCFKGHLNYYGVAYYGTFKFYNNLYDKSFVHNSKTPLGKLFYDILSINLAKGKVGNWTVSATKTKDGYLMRAQNQKYGYEAKDNVPIEIEGILPMKNFNNSLRFFLNNLQRAKVTLKNHDEFNGTVKVETNSDGTLNCELLNGTYKYHKTGDVFEGKYQEIYYGPDGIHVPTEGIMKLANGEQYRGDSWLTQYPDVRDFGCFFEDGDGPSEIRKLAQEKHQEFNKRKAEEQAKEEAEERAKKLQMQQREMEIQARRQYLINEYGYEYGSLLADDKVCLGMTKEMVSQVRNESNYSVTKYRDAFNDFIEIWTYRAFIAKGYNYTFTNGILTSYTE